MNILAIRFTAVGDLVISIPYLVDLLEKKPDFHIFLATKQQMQAFLPAHPRLHPQFFTLEDQKKGFWGLLKFFFRLRKLQIDVVSDLHNNIRSNILMRLFQLTGAKVFQLNKIRHLRKQNTRKVDKNRVNLPYIGHLYKEVLEHSSWASLQFQPLVDVPKYYPSDYKLPKKFDGQTLIGIAPFAARPTKIYPLEQMKAALDLLLIHKHFSFVFFGFGNDENKILDNWAASHPERCIVSRDLGGFNNEITVMSQLDLMVTMDSANLHFAFLAGTKTLSIWGTTHSDLGFAPPLSDLQHRLEISTDELTCRPCSVYGNKPCYRGDHACMQWITSETVAAKIMELASNE